MSRGLGQMQHAILASLKPAKRAYAAGKFDYIGGAGMKNLDAHSDAAAAKARNQWAARGSNQPNPRKAFHELLMLHEDAPINESEVLVFSGGEHTYLDEGVYDLRATLRYLAINLSDPNADGRNRRNERGWYPAYWTDMDRPGNRGYYWRVDPKFRISFYRAARNLIERGVLLRCDDDSGGQLRFVSMRPDIERKHEDAEE